jgi:hypothetical protein
MAVSDALYGPSKRYVSRERLEAMLEQEFAQIENLLGRGRGDAKRFFAFANTVATRTSRKQGVGRGWMGIRFQSQPHEKPSEVLVHAHLLDSTTSHQQEALGAVGVNLIHGAFYQRENPGRLIAALLDDLSRDRVEFDMIKVSGPAFPGMDNRLMSLQLVEQGLTDAAMFTAGGDVVQPSEVLYKRPVLIARGSFRPATRLTVDLLNRALAQFREEPGVKGKQPIVLAEMTLRSLAPQPDVSHTDFLARADILRSLGFDVLISRFEPFHEVAEFLAGSTDQPIGIAVGLPAIRQLIDEKFYTGLPGGALESAGRLFQRSVTVYVYPSRDSVSGRIETIDDSTLPPPWHHLRALLLELRRVVPIRDYDEFCLGIRTPDVLSRLQSGDPSWQEMVPAAVAETIKTKNLFGLRAISKLQTA